MNSDLRKKAKNDFEKESFKLVNNGVFFVKAWKMQKTQRKNKELFSIITKLLYCNIDL